MNAPPPSLPRSLPPHVAAASLAATLRGARRRRIRRRAGQSAAVLTMVCTVALGLQTIGSMPAGGVDPAPLHHSGKRPDAYGHTGDSDGTANVPPPVRTVPRQVEKSPPSVLISGTDLSPAPPDSRTVPPPEAKEEESSFVLIRSQPVETIRTRPSAPESEPAAAGYIAVSTVSMPSPLVITTARTVSLQAIATADGPEIPSSASDADLFSLADGRPAALCRMASGDARWFWLDRLASR